ncbi:MAG: hypothetical protein ABIZ80_12785 [Bryobacteraceae bacterium]
MRSLIPLLLAGVLTSGLATAQYGGREDDVVIYVFNAKGNPDPVVVAAGTGSATGGFEIKDPLTIPPTPFGPDFPAESFVNLHNEVGDNFRFVIQKEDLLIPTNEFLGPGKVLIIKGIVRLLIPNKEPIDLTAGLYAPFPVGTDFGPELPILEANSFLWTPVPFFPLIAKRPDGFIGPGNPSGKTGSEFVLDIGSFLGIIRWQALEFLYGPSWAQGIDFRMIERDTQLGSSARVLRLRPGRTTPPFVIRANTHLAVLSGRVNITPAGGQSRTLTAKQYAFVPNGLSIILSNPKTYSGPTAQ